MEDRPEVPKKSIFAVSALGLLMCGAAHAGIIGNGPPNQSGGSDLNSFLEADDFVIAPGKGLQTAAGVGDEGDVVDAFGEEQAGVGAILPQSRGRIRKKGCLTDDTHRSS